MSFCFIYNVVLENHSVRNPPRGKGGSIASSSLYSLDFNIHSNRLRRTSMLQTSNIEMRLCFIAAQANF